MGRRARLRFPCRKGSGFWPQLSVLIRFERAKRPCQGCRQPYGRLVCHLGDGYWWVPVRQTRRDEQGRPVRRGEVLDLLTQVRTKRMVLATAHRDHDPTNNNPRNLVAFCQRCHLQHDREDHRRGTGSPCSGRRHSVTSSSATIAEGGTTPRQGISLLGGVLQGACSAWGVWSTSHALADVSLPAFEGDLEELNRACTRWLDALARLCLAGGPLRHEVIISVGLHWQDQHGCRTDHCQEAPRVHHRGSCEPDQRVAGGTLSAVVDRSRSYAEAMSSQQSPRRPRSWAAFGTDPVPTHSGGHVGTLAAFAAVRLSDHSRLATEEPSRLEPVTDGKAALASTQLEQGRGLVCWRQHGSFRGGWCQS